MSEDAAAITAIRGHFLDVDAVCDDAASIAEHVRHVEDGLLLIRDGCIHWFGEWHRGKEQIPQGCSVLEYPGSLIVPGFIDTHVHFPQIGIIGAYGEQLLQWLENYAFPAELQFHDMAHARKMAHFFLNQLLRNGTTSAAVFCTVHPQSVRALFDAAAKINMRLIGGKVLMDRNAPSALLDTVESGYQESRELILQYHKKNRLLYAITPRFAPTSTPEQLEMAGQLHQEFPDTYVQTHLSENLDEIRWVQELFPERKNYLDVYRYYGLTGSRSLFGHCVHLDSAEWQHLQDSDSVITFCPSSNLFLGSGLFDLQRAKDNKIRVGMASDVGGGTSVSMLRTLGEAYKVSQLQGQKLSPWECLYMLTLGAARALDLDHCIGSFGMNKEADFVVLDPRATTIQARRLEQSKDIAELLFSLVVLGDDRSVLHSYVDGRLVYTRGEL